MYSDVSFSCVCVCGRRVSVFVFVRETLLRTAETSGGYRGVRLACRRFGSLLVGRREAHAAFTGQVVSVSAKKTEHTSLVGNGLLEMSEQKPTSCQSHALNY